MKKQILTSISFAGLILLIILIHSGCEKKTEQPKEEMKTEEDTAYTSSKISPPVVEEKISIPDLKGPWTGTFDKRTTTLTITGQTDSSFTGKISIKYRSVLNQDVEGTFSPANRKLTMSDQLHSHFMGKYNGNLSPDFKNLSGTFIKNSDGSKYSFNLDKK